MKGYHGLTRYVRSGCRCDRCAAAHERCQGELARYLAGESAAQIGASQGQTGAAVQLRLRLLTGAKDLRTLRPRRPCKVDGCDEDTRARGWCIRHYQRWANHGDPTYEPTRREPELTPVDEPPPDGLLSRTWTYDWRSVVDRCEAQRGQWFQVDRDDPMPGLVHTLKGFGLDAVWRAGQVYVRAPQESDHQEASAA